MPIAHDAAPILDPPVLLSSLARYLTAPTVTLNANFSNRVLVMGGYVLVRKNSSLGPSTSTCVSHPQEPNYPCTSLTIRPGSPRKVGCLVSFLLSCWPFFCCTVHVFKVWMPWESRERLNEQSCQSPATWIVDDWYSRTRRCLENGPTLDHRSFPAWGVLPVPLELTLP